MENKHIMFFRSRSDSGLSPCVRNVHVFGLIRQRNRSWKLLRINVGVNNVPALVLFATSILLSYGVTDQFPYLLVCEYSFE